jgi:hypothetical protein
MSHVSGLKAFHGADSQIAMPTRVRVTRLALVAALGIGVILRMLELVAGRSLSQDEAQLALNIIDRPFGDLFGRLDFNQAAPEGFLALQKLVVGAFGADDYSLRLVPFVAGTLALFLLVPLGRRVVSPPAVPLAVGLFAISGPSIFYTATDKQYAVDLLATVLVLLAGMYLDERRLDRSATLIFASVGAACVWLSHSSVFVLAGVSTALVIGSLLRTEWGSAVRVVAASAAWLISFGIFALTSLDTVAGIQQSLSNTAGAFAGSSATDLTDKGALRTSVGALRYVAGIPHFLRRGAFDAGELVVLLAAALCVVGAVSLLAKRRERGLALLSPIVFMLIAWGLGKYPLLGRTQLFLVPIYALLLAEGAVHLVTTARRSAVRVGSVLAAAAVGIAIVVPAVGQVVRTPTSNELKPVLDHIAREQRPGDTVYVYYTAQPQLRYYLECGCAGRAFEAARKDGLWPLRRAPGGRGQFAPAMRSVPPRFIVGQYRGSDPSLYVRDFEALDGRNRVWILLPEVENSTRESLLHELDARGTRVATFRVGDVHDFASAVVTYLYDMS